MNEKWSKSYKKSIDCNNPKGFSQKAHCAGRKKRQRGETTMSKSVNEQKLKEVELFLEKNVPTNPSKWSYYKSQAKKKFDVYPSAYANAWAAKMYKKAGGGWRTQKESIEELDEKKNIKVTFRSKAAKERYMKKQSLRPNSPEIVNQSDTSLTLTPDMKDYVSKKNHNDLIYQVETVNERYRPNLDSKGYDAAQKVIRQLQSSVFRKLDDDELLEFRKAIADAFNLDGILK
jgi:primosomal protein N'